MPNSKLRKIIVNKSEYTEEDDNLITEAMNTKYGQSFVRYFGDAMNCVVNDVIENAEERAVFAKEVISVLADIQADLSQRIKE